MARAGTDQVPVRATSPSSGGSRATYIDIHGGGFYMGSAARSDAGNARLADALGVTVVSVEYRLAPEYPWPAAPDDCETAALWLIEEGRQGVRHGADIGRWRLGRSHAGHDNAASAAGPGPCPTRWSAPCCSSARYDLSGQSPGGRLYADEWFIQAYAGHVKIGLIPTCRPFTATFVACLRVC